MLRRRLSSRRASSFNSTTSAVAGARSAAAAGGVHRNIGGGCGSKLRQSLPPLLVFIIGTVLAITLFFVSRGWEQDKAGELFQIEGERQLTGLNLGVDSFQPDNEAVLSFMQLRPNATWEEFQHFAGQQLAASPRQSAWSGLSYLPALPNEQRSAFEERACDLFCEATGKNYSTMFIRDSSGQPEIPKARYFPVFYIYPLETNNGAVLFDISSSASRNITINSAISSGEMRATPRITLVQENAKSYGMLIIRPIQKLMTDETTGEVVVLPGEASLQGLTSGVVRIKNLVEVVSTETQTKSMQLYIFDTSEPECRMCGAQRLLGGSCPACSDPNFMHAVSFDNNAALEWSIGFRVLENDTTVPEFNLQQVQEMAARSRLVFAEELNVYGRTWSMMMIGVEEEWVQTLSPWVLFGIMLLATLVVTLLMFSATRQHNIMVSLQRKDIARLKVITQQQRKDRALSAASEIKGLLKALTANRYPDGSEKVSNAIKSAKLPKTLATADFLAVVCVRLCHHSDIAKQGRDKTVRSMQYILMETYQELLVKNSGHDVTNSEQMVCGGLTAVFDSVMHACSFIMQLSRRLAETEWPYDILQLPHCGLDMPEGAVSQQRGPRIAAAIHWGKNSTWTTNASGMLHYSGVASQLAFEVAQGASNGQILVTKPAANELLGRTEAADFPHMSPLGLYALKQASEPMVLSQLEPAPWDMLHPGIAKPGFVEGLDKVGRCPSNLVAHPDPATERVHNQQDKEKDSGGTSATSTSGVMVSLSVVVMSCPILMKGSAPDHVLALVDNLVEAMAQTFCGYLVPYTGVNWKLPHVVFMTPVNAVRFCAALQLALLHVPWEIEDDKFQDPVQLTVMGRAVFQGPRVSMLIAHLPPDSYKWIAIVQKSRTRGQMSASLNVQRSSISSGSDSTFSSTRPHVMISHQVRNMMLRSAEVDSAEKILTFVAPGQIVLTGPSWNMVADQMPDETRPIDLGTYALLKFSQPLQLMEVQVRLLQEREFPPLPVNLKKKPGYHDAPGCDSGIAYLVCKIKEPEGEEGLFQRVIEEWIELVRTLLPLHDGYECNLQQNGSFNLAFATIEHAVRFSVTAQRRLIDTKTAEEVATLPGCEEIRGPDGVVIFRGLRVKMGLAFGVPQGKRPSAIGHADYQGPLIYTAAACVTVASPGQVLLGGSEDLLDGEGKLKEITLNEPGCRPIQVEEMGMYQLRGVPNRVPIYNVSHPDLVQRTFTKLPGKVLSGSIDSGTGQTMWDEHAVGNPRRSTSTDRITANSFADAVQEAMSCNTAKYRADESVEIQQIIGMGSFGKVYKGLWKGVTVAYKVIQYPGNTMGSHEKLHTTAIMETAISASMSHPHIVQTYSYNIKPIYTKNPSQASEVSEIEAKDWDTTADERSWAGRNKGDGSVKTKLGAEGGGAPSIMVWEVQIIQEFCDHGSLRSVLSDKAFLGRNGHMDTAVMLKLAGDVARGMLHIHSMQIVHGDLKALNILVTGESSLIAKVADFGLSVRMEHDQTHVSGMHAGTLTHMAPEILMAGRLSKAADVYAFGILMYELQTRQKAFKGVPMHQLTSDVCNKMRRPVFPPDAPIKWVELATRCWDHTPENRPTFAEIVRLIDEMKGLHAKGELTPVAAEVADNSTLQGLMYPITENDLQKCAIQEGEEEEQLSDGDFSGTIDVAGMDVGELRGLVKGNATSQS